MDHVKVLQVVGYKNSGKTTLITQWTKLLTRKSRNVAVIKHHGHGGALQQPHAETDSMRFMEAGSVSSIVFDDQLVQLHMKQHPPALSTVLEMAKLAEPEIILIEGVKAAHYPKAVLVRTSADLQLLKRLKHVIAVLVHEDADNETIRDMIDDYLSEAAHSNCVVLRRNEQTAIDQFILRWIDMGQ